MGQVSVVIGGRTYPLSCRDGDEPHLNALAADIATKAGALVVQLGQMSEARLLLMTALTIADDLHEARKVPSSAGAPDPRLAALVARAEALADVVSDTLQG